MLSRETVDGHGAARPCSLLLAFAKYACQAGSAVKGLEASQSARSALLFMHLSRPSFCESYDRRIFATTGGQQRPRFGSLALMVTV